jgi:para-nitrobenzyl esterase
MKKTEIIEINSGRIQGYIEDELKIFKGIPYAEPPIDDLRFEQPVEKKPWDGVFDAIKYGNCCFQGYSILQKYLGKLENENEDCLNLNIWTPDTDNGKRPVMIFCHGGAFFFGGGTDPVYDGSKLSKKGNLIVVTINYRLGSFGFFYLPDELPINVGLLDQVLALKWVQDNIGYFGGDPRNVTIFGESAGAYSVVCLSTMPKAKGLFKRAIVQSAPAIAPSKSKRVSKKIVKTLGIKKGNIQELRNISPEKIIKAQDEVFAQDPTNIMALRPFIDGNIIPEHPLKVIREGRCSHIDFMMGTNMEEGKLFTLTDRDMRDIGEDTAKNLISGYLMMQGIKSDRVQLIMETYEEIYSKDYKEIFSAVITDLVFRVSTTRLLNAQSQHQQNTYSYLFAHKSPALKGILGSCHALELPFVFGTYSEPKWAEFAGKGPAVQALSEIIMDAWISFAHNGDPNHENLPEWLPYQKDRATMKLAKECEVIYSPFEKERSAWDGLLEI